MINSSHCFLLFLIIAGVGVGSKPIDDPSFDPEVNEVDTKTLRDQRKSVGVEVGAKKAKGRSLNAQTTTLPRIFPAVFSPEIFVQERIDQLKNNLENLGSIFPNQKDPEGKELPGAVGGLANLVGLNDSGFYTNGFDPAGFFGGNGWFANKGGLLGGPGALISTGSLFTDYQTAYRK